MTRILVWDLLKRLFHWLLTATVVAAMAIALVSMTTAPFFHVHMLLGLLAGFMVLLRLVWGFAGLRYTHFGLFLFGPKALVEYLVGVFPRTVLSKRLYLYVLWNWYDYCVSPRCARRPNWRLNANANFVAPE